MFINIESSIQLVVGKTMVRILTGTCTNALDYKCMEGLCLVIGTGCEKVVGSYLGNSGN